MIKNTRAFYFTRLYKNDCLHYVYTWIISLVSLGRGVWLPLEIEQRKSYELWYSEGIGITHTAGLSTHLGSSIVTQYFVVVSREPSFYTNQEQDVIYWSLPILWYCDSICFFSRLFSFIFFSPGDYSTNTFPVLERQRSLTVLYRWRSQFVDLKQEVCLVYSKFRMWSEGEVYSHFWLWRGCALRISKYTFFIYIFLMECFTNLRVILTQGPC